jgi:class 3 adenylate cyclase
MKNVDEVLANFRDAIRRARAINNDPAWQQASEFASRTLGEMSKIVSRHRGHAVTQTRDGDTVTFGCPTCGTQDVVYLPLGWKAPPLPP